ncbi:hypothetical protein GCM10009551_019440 [Nocardiopsis tropica]
MLGVVAGVGTPHGPEIRSPGPPARATGHPGGAEEVSPPPEASFGASRPRPLRTVAAPRGRKAARARPLGGAITGNRGRRIPAPVLPAGPRGDGPQGGEDVPWEGPPRDLAACS